MFIIEDGRDSFYQWDLNRRLIVRDSSITDVHFCNRTDDCSLVVEVYEENGAHYANVPNILLQTDWRINVYAWDSEYTKHSILFHVNSRTKPADYVYTETEVKTWDALEDEIHGAIEALNDAEEKRITAEDQRALAEDIRIQNEAVRVAAEIERNEAEAIRVDNELARVSAENERAENYAEIKTSAEEAKALVTEGKNIFANALKGNKTGAVISASDVSPIEHELDVKVSSKNLFDISKVDTYRAGGSGSNPGVSGYGIINNGDGTLTVYTHDTVTSAYLANNGTLRDFAPDLKVGETYTLNATSIKANGEASNAQRIYLNQAKTVWTFKKSLTITEEMLSSRVHWYVDVKTGADQVATISNIQIEKGTTATTYTPYIDVEGTKVKRLGKNFANLAGLPETKKYKAVTNTISGYRIDDDGNIIITSCSTDIASLPYVGTNIKLSELCPEARVGMTMRLRVIDSYSEGASKGNVCIYLDKAATVWAFTETAKAITITQNMLDSNVVFYASYTLNAVRTLSNFQIELGENATEYEPYREPVEAIVDAEGNVKGLMSLAPNMTLVGENGTVIDCTYNRDINKAFEEITQAIVSLGNNT